jgi:hypothetical protein
MLIAVWRCFSRRLLLCAGAGEGICLRWMVTLQTALVLHPPGASHVVYQPALAGRNILKRAHVGTVVAAAFSPDDSAVLGVTAQGAVLCYRLPPW